MARRRWFRWALAQTCRRLAVLDRGRVVFEGDSAELVRVAEGATWTVAIAGPPPAGDPTVDSAIQEGAATGYRLVADVPPPVAVAAEPGLEDGYVALMRRTRIRA